MMKHHYVYVIRDNHFFNNINVEYITGRIYWDVGFLFRIIVCRLSGFDLHTKGSDLKTCCPPAWLFRCYYSVSFFLLIKVVQFVNNSGYSLQSYLYANIAVIKPFLCRRLANWANRPSGVMKPKETRY